MIKSNSPHITQQKRFVSERELASIVSREVRTLQKDRLLGTGPYPHYKVGRQVLYDVDECIQVIERNRAPGSQGQENRR